MSLLQVLQMLILIHISAPYVKLYVVNGKRCIAKAKTMTARKTLDPFYQQLLAFKENCQGCILQVRDTQDLVYFYVHELYICFSTAIRIILICCDFYFFTRYISTSKNLFKNRMLRIKNNINTLEI